MAFFEMIKYHSKEYPGDIPLRAEECAAHFDITAVKTNLEYSLHTEYSYGKRKLDSALIRQFPALAKAQKNGVPQLWKDRQWAAEFVQFLCMLAGNEVPRIIEIHPPFNDYSSFDDFLKVYKEFETLIVDKYPDIEILLENRCGSVYKGGKFLISKIQDLETLCELIEHNSLRLKIACDIPQIYTAHNVKKPEQYIDLLGNIASFRSHIGGVHLWGKRKSDKGRLVAHCGDLTSYFEGNSDLKDNFLCAFNDCFDDGVVRKLVLEVNSGNDDMISIIEDLRDHGAEFCCP